MKKERILVLCLCVLLSGILHTQWIVWAWRHALPSTTQAVRLAHASARTRIEKGTPQFSIPSNLATALACAAWPPLGILYSEVLVLGKRPDPQPENRQMPEQGPSLALRYFASSK